MNNPAKKKCCVLIPYFNAGESLISSIDSVDHNSFSPDIIVVDDGSKLFSAADALKKYSGPLTIKLVEMQKNQGIEHALNKGLQIYGADYEYIARLDCGDLCKSERIKKQIEFFELNKEFHLIGSWVDFVTMKGEHLFTLRQPESFETIKNKMFLNATFTHPSIMFRSSILEKTGYYPIDAPAAEDYAFFFNIIKHYTASNIQESLVSCTIDPNGISTKKRRIQIKSRIKIIIKNFNLNQYALYGLLRSIILLYTPRKLTIFLNKIRNSELTFKKTRHQQNNQ
ncbi:UDP-Gal:alpha-D-GlcNAc-diphosphoundecaprenol beta-1,3-galactosyltransferase [compost metagenome]